MKRDIYEQLIKWKASARRKPLLIKGARQTGKTYILKQFGINEYDTLAYFNFEEDPLLKDFFLKGFSQSNFYKTCRCMPGRVFDQTATSSSSMRFRPRIMLSNH